LNEGNSNERQKAFFVHALKKYLCQFFLVTC